MKASEILRGAKSTLQTKGWCKEAYINDAGAVCLLGAVNYAANGRASHLGRTPADKYLKRALGVEYDDAVADWNDAAGRTENEVLGALDMAISLAEQEGQ